jgi:aspartate carbamoyltransferase catalytic subunit
MNAAKPEQIFEDEARLQLKDDGSLRHLLTLKGLERSLLVEILDDAERFLTPASSLPASSRALEGRTVANLFFEPSTRTRASFDLAGKRLGADVLNLDVNTSSRKKGESILDTIYTLEAMRCDIMVVRDASAGVPAYIARHVKEHVSILNAGESDVSHPTQGLLDLLTMRRHKGGFENLVVAIVGDIRHSRVARSTGWGLHTLGVGELRLVSPPSMAPAPDEMPFARLCDKIDEGVAGADVVMALRIQRERISDLDGIPGTEEYFANYGVSHERMKLAKPDAIVMHPGPMNRGIEIEGSLADSPQSVITEQVANGVAIRMAVLERVAKTLGGR